MSSKRRLCKAPVGGLVSRQFIHKGWRLVAVTLHVIGRVCAFQPRFFPAGCQGHSSFAHPSHKLPTSRSSRLLCSEASPSLCPLQRHYPVLLTARNTNCPGHICQRKSSLATQTPLTRSCCDLPGDTLLNVSP